MTDSPAAQITYTTNPLLSPAVIGGLVTLIASIASGFGVHVLDDPALQQQLVVAIGILGTAFAHYLWPHKDGRLSFTAPLSTPAPVNVPVGEASVVTVPKPSDQSQTATVQPIDVGTQVVKVSPAMPETRHAEAEPMTVTVSPTRG